jgi:dTDP-4-dehydrorhamnose reductase
VSRLTDSTSENEKQLKKTTSEKKLASKILITGSEGYVGSSLKTFLRSIGYDVYGIDLKTVSDEKIYHLDMTDAQRVLSVFNSIKPDIVVHAAALSSLNECEKNPDLAKKVNVETTGNLIDAIGKINKDVKLVFLSSDYVFDGKRGNYREEDEVNPQTVYGKTKALSEVNIRAHLENYVICRTANVYGRGGNFFNFLFGMLVQNKPVEVFGDVFYTPTYIDYLLDSLKGLIDLDFKGIIHIVGPERLSRYDFALKMAETLGKEESLIQPVKAFDKLIAKDSSLNCEYSRKVLRNYSPSVEESLHFCWGNLISPYYYSVDTRGHFLGVFQGNRWEEVNYLESVGGSVRGNHYHKETAEGFFIIDGKIRVTLTDILTGSKRAFVVKKGNVLIINTNTLHTFEMLENSKWINLLSKPIDNKSKDIHFLSDK